MNKMSQKFPACLFAVAPEANTATKMTRTVRAPAMRPQETDRAKITGSGPQDADGKKTKIERNIYFNIIELINEQNVSKISCMYICTCLFAVAPKARSATRTGQAPAISNGRAAEMDRAKSTHSGPPNADVAPGRSSGKKSETKRNK
jgi:hypothetical protein